MSFGQASNTLNLLGQQSAPAAPKVSPSAGGPQFEIRWNSFHQTLGSSIYALLTGPTPRKNFVSRNFRDCSVEGRIPRAAVVAAALWHIVFLERPGRIFPRRRAEIPRSKIFSSPGPVQSMTSRR
jgi:hypothetical protein